MSDSALCPASSGGHHFVTVSTLRQQFPPPSWPPGAPAFITTVISWWETVTRCVYCGVTR